MAELLFSLFELFGKLLTSLAFWIALGVLLLLILCVFWYRKMKLRALSCLEYSRSFSTDGVFVGDTLEFTEYLHNATAFPLLFANLDFFVPAGLTVDDVACKEYVKLTSVFHIPPYATLCKKHTVRADRRAHFLLESAAILYRNNEFTFACPIDFYAYPVPADASALVEEPLFRTGERIAGKKTVDDPFFISGIRPYQMGDPMRHINFRASVRAFSGGMRQLMCNSYDSSRNFDIMIILDMNEGGEDESRLSLEEKLESGLNCACYLFSESVRNGGNVGFAANLSANADRFVFIPCGSGEEHRKRILECFASLTTLGRRDYSVDALIKLCEPRIPREADVCLITSAVDAKLSATLGALESTGRCVSTITHAGGRCL